MTNRQLTGELMDDPNADRAELERALSFIRVVNQRLRGAAAAIMHLRRWSADWSRDETVRIIDLGTGSADIPLAIADWAQRTGHRVHITGVDRHPTTIEAAKQLTAGHENIEILQADALKLMDIFAPGSFDYAHAGMFLHHLEDIEVMTVLRIMDRLTTRGVIWNDLCRNWAGKAGARLLTIGAPRMIRHDAIVSVDAGFTKREAIDLARRAGWSNIAYRRHLLYRFTLTSLKRTPAR